ncbi:MAG: hypothetical protein V3T53_16170 [Phycisphaerales bacterium]
MTTFACHLPPHFALISRLSNSSMIRRGSGQVRCEHAGGGRAGGGEPNPVVGYTLEMRRRMTAIICAYFASGPGPLMKLRDEFGVTHLIVDRRHYQKGANLSFFEPFDTMTHDVVSGLHANRRRCDNLAQPAYSRQAESLCWISGDCAHHQRFGRTHGAQDDLIIR